MNMIRSLMNMLHIAKPLNAKPEPAPSKTVPQGISKDAVLPHGGKGRRGSNWFFRGADPNGKVRTRQVVRHKLWLMTLAEVNKRNLHRRHGGTLPTAFDSMPRSERRNLARAYRAKAWFGRVAA